MHSAIGQVAICDLDVERWLTAVPGASSAWLLSELRPRPEVRSGAAEPPTLRARAQIRARRPPSGGQPPNR